ncbi:MAG: prepilin-type N-terminal cleavage/methylation domain-containing protein [Leptospirillum sp.]|jgi:general secretion pathway protein I|nr:prepilin-type N-terminal cleavage/methylation domain-containing protein [Nitrospiraceae bacterium]
MRKSDDGGFTLIEVMVALFIFSVAAIALLAIRTNAVKLDERARDEVEMTVLANRKMSEIVGQGFAPVGDVSGGFGKEHKDYHWEEIVTASPLPIIRQVTVKITKKSGKRKIVVTLVSYISGIQ